MKAYDAFELAARNLRESVLRNALTTMGIAVGVASLVAMLSLGIGLQLMASQRLNRAGLFDTIIVFPQREFGAQRRNSQREQRQANEPSRPLDQSARAALAKIPGVVQVYPEIRFGAEVRADDKSQFGNIASLPSSSRDNDVFENMKGKFFSSDAAEEAILQGEFAAALGGGADAPKEVRDKLAAGLVGKDIVIRYAERQASQLPVDNRAAADDGRAPARREPTSAEQDSAARMSAAEINAADWGFSVVPRELKLRVVGIVERLPFSFSGMGNGNVIIPVVLAEKLNPLQPGDMRATAQRSSERIYTDLVLHVDKPTH